MNPLAVDIAAEQFCYRGELHDLRWLPDRLAEAQGRWGSDSRQIPPTVTVTDDPGALLALLHRRFARPGEPGCRLWQWTMHLRPATVWLGRTTSTYEALTPHLSLFGWAAKRGRHRRPGGTSRYYPVLDAYAWAGDVLDHYPGLRVEQMTRFAQDLHQFCTGHKLTPAWTPAAIAGQLLRRNTPKGRKVPQATNSRARRHLPGNMYRTVLPRPASDQDGPLRVRGEVLEIDLASAHHWAAMHLHAPHPASLYAWGRFYEPARGKPENLIPIEELAGREHGLLLAAVESHNRPDPLSHPAINHQGVRWRYLWTPEIQAIEQEGAQILGVKAGWTSNQTDEGLNEYAWWAQEQLQAADPARRGWLKQALLATYGLLAARPRPFTHMTRWGHGDPTAVTLRSGHTVHGRVCQTRSYEPRTTNVIWRGMIEAWVRAEMLTQARELRNDGWRIVSLYADAVYIIARGDTQPDLRPGWRVSQRLHNMRMTAPTHFRSDEIDKLPGIPHARRNVA